MDHNANTWMDVHLKQCHAVLRTIGFSLLPDCIRGSVWAQTNTFSTFTRLTAATAPGGAGLPCLEGIVTEKGSSACWRGRCFGGPL